MQSDPIGLAGGINSFAYVYSSPMVYTDSSGLAAEAIFFGYENSYVGAVKYVSPVGTFTIGAHGYINLDTFLGTRAIKGPDGKPLTGAEVWELIKEDFESGEYETIRVAACWAGRPDRTGRSFADDLAAASGHPVEATRHLVGFPESGRMFIGRPTDASKRQTVPLRGAQWEMSK